MSSLSLVNKKMADSRNETHAPKRKRKKSYLKKQKNYGKKGKFGRGFELSEELYNYFIRMMEVLNKSKEKEEKEMLATNILQEITGNEVDICSNQFASTVVEKILPFASDNEINALMSVLASDSRVVFTDPYCSHVLQKALVVQSERLFQGNRKEDDLRNKMIQCFVRIAMFALNNLEDFIFDMYANHILRTIFSCINGKAAKEVSESGEGSTNIPNEFSELSESFTSKMVAWPQFNDLTTQTLPSRCLQDLLISVKDNPKAAKKLSKRVMVACDVHPDIDLTDEKHENLLCLIEAAIIAAPMKTFSKIYTNYFKGKILQFALSKNGNFAVQKLLQVCPTKELFEDIFGELSSSFENIFNAKFFGIFVAMAKSCKRLKSREGDFSKLLIDCLHCNEPMERRNMTALLLCCLCNYESYNAATSKISLQGSLLVQEMLGFTKPIRLVTSILSTSDQDLMSLLCDQMGCHVTDAFCTSTFVGEKNRDSLYKRLRTKYVQLASDKYGSRSFDAIWNTLNRSQRIIIMDELKTNQSSLQSTLFGRVIARKVQLDLYRNDSEEWLKKCAPADHMKFNKHKKRK